MYYLVDKNDYVNIMYLREVPVDVGHLVSLYKALTDRDVIVRKCLLSDAMIASMFRDFKLEIYTYKTTQKITAMRAANVLKDKSRAWLCRVHRDVREWYHKNKNIALNHLKDVRGFPLTDLTQEELEKIPAEGIPDPQIETAEQLPPEKLPFDQLIEHNSPENEGAYEGYKLSDSEFCATTLAMEKEAIKTCTCADNLYENDSSCVLVRWVKGEGGETPEWGVSQLHKQHLPLLDNLEKYGLGDYRILDAVFFPHSAHKALTYARDIINVSSETLKDNAAFVTAIYNIRKLLYPTTKPTSVKGGQIRTIMKIVHDHIGFDSACDVSFVEMYLTFVEELQKNYYKEKLAVDYDLFCKILKWWGFEIRQNRVLWIKIK